jgi:hypothetical protein
MHTRHLPPRFDDMTERDALASGWLSRATNRLFEQVFSRKETAAFDTDTRNADGGRIPGQAGGGPLGSRRKVDLESR